MSFFYLLLSFFLFLLANICLGLSFYLLCVSVSFCFLLFYCYIQTQNIYNDKDSFLCLPMTCWVGLLAEPIQLSDLLKNPIKHQLLPVHNIKPVKLLLSTKLLHFVMNSTCFNNLGWCNLPKINHQKVSLFGPIFKINLIQFTSPIIFDAPSIIKFKFQLYIFKKFISTENQK